MFFTFAFFTASNCFFFLYFQHLTFGFQPFGPYNDLLIRTFYSDSAFHYGLFIDDSCCYDLNIYTINEMLFQPSFIFFVLALCGFYSQSYDLPLGCFASISALHTV